MSLLQHVITYLPFHVLTVPRFSCKCAQCAICTSELEPSPALTSEVVTIISNLVTQVNSIMQTSMLVPTKSDGQKSGIPTIPHVSYIFMWSFRKITPKLSHTQNLLPGVRGCYVITKLYCLSQSQHFSLQLNIFTKYHRLRFNNFTIHETSLPAEV